MTGDLVVRRADEAIIELQDKVARLEKAVATLQRQVADAGRDAAVAQMRSSPEPNPYNPR